MLTLSTNLVLYHFKVEITCFLIHPFDSMQNGIFWLASLFPPSLVMIFGSCQKNTIRRQCSLAKFSSSAFVMSSNSCFCCLISPTKSLLRNFLRWFPPPNNNNNKSCTSRYTTSLEFHSRWIILFMLLYFLDTEWQ